MEAWIKVHSNGRRKLEFCLIRRHGHAKESYGLYAQEILQGRLKRGETLKIQKSSAWKQGEDTLHKLHITIT